MEFCVHRDDTPRLAVLGVFSHYENLHHRSSIRSTWLPAASQTMSEAILTRFVMRGVGLASNATDEAAAHGDIVFVRGVATMGRKSGPLQTLMLWFSCAVSAWPSAELVGKGDDDVWAHMPSVAAVSVLAPHPSLRASSPAWASHATFCIAASPWVAQLLARSATSYR